MTEARPSPPADPLQGEPHAGELPGPGAGPLRRETAPVPPAEADPAADAPLTDTPVPDAGTDVLGPALAAQAARDPRWPEALAQARWALRIGQRKRRPDGTEEDWVDPETRAELERRGRLRLAVYDAADEFVAREGRAPNKREQRQLVARVIVEEEETQQAWDAAAAAFAQGESELARSHLRRVAAGGSHEAEEKLRLDPQLTDGDSLRAQQIVASADGEERNPFSDLRRAGRPDAEQDETWRIHTGQDIDKLLPAEERWRAVQQIERRLDEGRAEGLTPRQVAARLTDPAEVARYAVALAGRDLSPDRQAFLEALLTGRTARSFLEDEARRMTELVQTALDKLPADIWKQLETSWPTLSRAERHAALRRVTTQVAEELGVRGTTLRSHRDYSGDSRGLLAFMLSNIDVNLRQLSVADAVAGTNNAFLGHPGFIYSYPVDILMLVVAEEAVHLAQRQARAEFEEGAAPTGSTDLTRLKLLSANAANYYQARDRSRLYNPKVFRRYLLQPMEFEAKVMLQVLASRGYAEPEDVRRLLLDRNSLFD